MQVSEFISSLESVGGSLNVIGESTLGEPIHLIRKGERKKGGVLLVGGVHAREYITSYLLRDLIKEYNDYQQNKTLSLLPVPAVKSLLRAFFMEISENKRFGYLTKLKIFSILFTVIYF